MKTYNVVINYTATGTVEVNADTEYEAKQIAFDRFYTCNRDWDYDDWTCESCEEI